MSEKAKEPQLSEEEKAIQKRIDEAVVRINAALAETQTVLDPWIDYNPHGAIPRVRIVPRAPEPKEELAKEIKVENGDKKAKRSK